MPIKTPFQTYQIKKGQVRGLSKSFWPFSSNKTDASGEVTTEQLMGIFKGIITVETDDERTHYETQKKALIRRIKLKLNSISQERHGKPFNFEIQDLDTHEGRMSFRMNLEKLDLGHLEIDRHLMSAQENTQLKQLMQRTQKCTIRLYIVSAYDLASRDNGSPSDPYLYIQLGNVIIN